MIKSTDGKGTNSKSKAYFGWPISRSATISISSVLIFFIIWQIAPALGLVNSRFTSQPSKVLAAGWIELGTSQFWWHARISFIEFSLGLGLSLFIALPLASLMVLSKTARYMIDPPLMALYIAPSLILLPILILWLGIGMASKVAVVFLGAFFPIVVNTMAGMRQVDTRLLTMARGFGAGRVQLFFTILVPASLPSFLTGVRLGIGRGVLGVIVGELYAAQAGIGYQLSTFGNSMRIDLLLVYALVVSTFGYGLTEFVRMLELRFKNWAPK